MIYYMCCTSKDEFRGERIIKDDEFNWATRYYCYLMLITATCKLLFDLIE